MEIRVRGRGRRAKRRGLVDGVAPSNWERSTASTRSVGSGRRRRLAGRRSRPGGPGRVVPKGAGSDASLGGGRVAGGDPEAGVGRPAATRKQGVGGIGGAETISLRRLVWRLSRFGGFDGSRHLRAWWPQASADHGISVDHTTTHKNTSYALTSSSDLAGRSGVVPMPMPSAG